MSQDVRYPYFGVPPVREPRPALEVPALRGKRVILSLPDGFVYDVRAVSECRLDGHGAPVVEVVSEEDYFRWMFLKEATQPVAYPANLVWVD